jgi:HAD superfamily hydrolase (TIGR01450 family)
MDVDAFVGVGTGRGTTRGVVPVPQSSSPPFSMIVATASASSSGDPSSEDDGVESSSGRLVGRAATVVTPPPPPTMVDGLSSPLILDNYDTFLLDMWGVMHDGRAPYEGVLRAVRKLKESGKRLIVLSNSSKRREDAERMLVELGFDIADFHDIVTSGDVSHRLLRGDAGGGVAGCENWDAIDDVIAERGAAGRRKNVFVFGSGDDDGGYCESAGWTPSSVEDADLLLARGTFTIDDGSGTVIHKGDNEALYWEVMERSMMVASRRKLPMLVSNPDKVRPDAGSKTPMPGAIGDAYERFVWTTNCNPVGDMTEEGARSYVRRIGKPFGEVYDIALSSVSSSMSSSSSSSSDDDDEDGPRRDRVIMIGDALETDVVGGDNAGIDVLWVVNDGIHGADVRADGMGGVDGALGRFNRNNEHTYAYGRVVAPRYATDHFRW